MSNKVLQEILKLYQLPLYTSKEELLDKVFSCLYVRYKFKKITLQTKEDIPFAQAIFEKSNIIGVLSNNKPVVLSKKKVDSMDEVKQVIIKIPSFEDQDQFLQVKLGKGKNFFKKVGQFEIFFQLVGQYFIRNFAIFDLLREIERIANSNVSAAVSKPNLDEPGKQSKADINSLPEPFETPTPPTSKVEFLSINPKNMPNQIKMVDLVEKFEKKIIKEMLRRNGNVKSVTAKQLGITERMIGYKIQKYKL